MTAVGCTLTASLACTAQACCPSTCRTSGRSARSTPSMRPRGRSRRRSMATRRPAPTATASRATRPCPRAATGGAASRGCRRTATRTPAAPSGARSAPTPSGSARGRRGRRRTRSGWADTVMSLSLGNTVCILAALTRRTLGGRARGRGAGCKARARARSPHAPQCGAGPFFSFPWNPCVVAACRPPIPWVVCFLSSFLFQNYFSWGEPPHLSALSFSLSFSVFVAMLLTCLATLSARLARA